MSSPGFDSPITAVIKQRTLFNQWISSVTFYNKTKNDFCEIFKPVKLNARIKSGTYKS